MEATWYRESLFLGALESRVSAKRKERETENKRDTGALFKLLRREISRLNGEAETLF
jgi:hypothetical protein